MYPYKKHKKPTYRSCVVFCKFLTLTACERISDYRINWTQKSGRTRQPEALPGLFAWDPGVFAECLVPEMQRRH